MKIGILTFHLGPNHGGYLQAHSLCEYIKSMGHDVEIINYKNAHHHDRETFRPWIYRRPFKLYHAWIKERVFQKAYKDLPLSEFTMDVHTVEWEKYDAVVIGSDVVWDFSLPWLGHDHVYFGDFGGEYNGKKIAYAPSSGSVHPETPIPTWVKEGLAGMDGICARDENTASIVRSACGRDPLVVVDPTWLNMEFRETPVAKENYLVVYAYEVSKEEQKAIVAYARKNGLKIIALGYYQAWADENNMKLGPLEWLATMERATAVVAGTFHGTLYAIKSQSQFVTLYNDRIKFRIQKPLQAANLEDHMLDSSSDFETIMDQKIDYKDVMKRLSPYIQGSRDYLAQHLS